MKIDSRRLFDESRRDVGRFYPCCYALLLLGITTFVSGCATITTGTHQMLTVHTPGITGARCIVLQQGLDPLPVDDFGEVIVPRNARPLTVECRREGFATTQATLKPGIDSHAKFELPTGYLVDYLSGARYRYPSAVTVEMIADNSQR
jgi:hypothetical protein